MSSSRNTWLLLSGIESVLPDADIRNAEPVVGVTGVASMCSAPVDAAEWGVRSAATASADAESRSAAAFGRAEPPSSNAEPCSAVFGRGEPSTTVGSASSELMRSMTILTPVELTGLACGVGRGDASVWTGFSGERRRRGGLRDAVVS